MRSVHNNGWGLLPGKSSRREQDTKMMGPTIVVVALYVLGRFIQPELIQLLLSQLVPETNIQGTVKGSELQLGEARALHGLRHPWVSAREHIRGTGNGRKGHL